MSTFITLDWLAFTFKERTKESEQFCTEYLQVESGNSEPARNGYKSAIRTQDNVVCMWHDDRPEMGQHIVVSGSALRKFCERTGMEQREVVSRVCDAGASITRLDIAKDVENVQINLSAIWDCIRAKQTKGTTRTFARHESGTGGITIYAGSRQSERFIRIYDKADEQGMGSGEWKRYEVESKGMVARALAHVLSGAQDWNAVFNDLALNMVSVHGCPDYELFFRDTEVRIGIPKIEKTSDREAWILSQCYPAIMKHYHENPDSEAVRVLFEGLQFEQRSRTIEK